MEIEGCQGQGFYTTERREAGQRVGFDVVTLCGNKGKLATIQTQGYFITNNYYLREKILHERYQSQGGFFECYCTN